MAFVLTLMYVAFALLSPSVLPVAIMELHVIEILGVVVILSLLPSIGQSKIGSIPDSYLVAGVFFAACVSILATGWWGHVFDAVMGFYPIVFAYFIVLITCRTLSRLNTFVFLLLGVALFIFAQGAIADHSGNLTSHYLFAERNDAGGWIYRYKGLGVLSDPNDLSQLFTMVIPLLWLNWQKGKSFRNVLLTILPAVALAAGVFFTHSRGGAIALIAVCLFGLKDKLGVVKSSILAGILLAVLVAMNITGGRGLNEDDGGRVMAWITGLEVFKSHPLFGIGIGNFGQYNDTGSTAHNSFVLALAELGIFGYFFWMGSIVTVWSGLSRIIRSQPTEAASADASPTPNTLISATPAHLAFLRPALPGVPAMAAARSTAAPSTPYRPQINQSRAPGNWSALQTPINASAWEARPPEDEDRIVHAAKVMRVALVGLLTSSFFLSRSFSMVFYLLLAMSAALKLIYQEQHPEFAAKDTSLFRRIWLVIFASVVLLYLFVRIRGVH